jgi:anti-sigma-K factor RskA
MAPDVHSLVAPYALDALPETEEREFEQHLALCERCQRELGALREAAAALAYGAGGPEPPPELRERILSQARAERPNVVPLRRRLRWTVPLGAAATVAAAAAVALAVWAWQGNGSGGTTYLELKGAAGQVAVTEDGDAILSATMTPAPAGKTYEAWVVQGAVAQPAGLFRGGRVRLLLTRPLPHGARVAVTIEKRGGAKRPTSTPLAISEPS